MTITLKCTVVAVMATALLATVAWAHPSSGYQVQDVHPQYGESNYGFKPEMSFGEVTFSQLPQRNSLSLVEQYMLAGSTSSSYGHALDSWYTVIWGHVSRYWEVTKTLPERLTPEVMKTAYGDDIFDRAPEWLEEIKNPVSGEYPLVTSEAFSAGNLFIHNLTPAEINHFATTVPLYKQRWSDNLGYDPESDSNYEIEMQSPIMYIRVYGETGIIENHIIYSYNQPSE